MITHLNHFSLKCIFVGECDPDDLGFFKHLIFLIAYDIAHKVGGSRRIWMGGPLLLGHEVHELKRLIKLREAESAQSFDILFVMEQLIASDTETRLSNL